MFVIQVYMKCIIKGIDIIKYMNKCILKLTILFNNIYTYY